MIFKMRTIFCCIAFLILHHGAIAQQKKNNNAKAVVQKAVKKDTLVELSTSYGVMLIKLYDSTPIHRSNFIRLVKEGFYDSLLFHRVIESFMIQGGDPESKNAAPGAMLGNGAAPGNRIPAEMNAMYYHKKGALAAARDNNPEKASSNCQFYIVMGKTFTDIDLNRFECVARASNPAFTYTAEQRQVYKTTGGTPHLDQNYTVFGEVVQGLDVIDKIAKAEKDKNNRPVQDIRMKMRLIY